MSNRLGQHAHTSTHSTLSLTLTHTLTQTHTHTRDRDNKQTIIKPQHLLKIKQKRNDSKGNNNNSE